MNRLSINVALCDVILVGHDSIYIIFKSFTTFIIKSPMRKNTFRITNLQYFKSNRSIKTCIYDCGSR